MMRKALAALAVLAAGSLVSPSFAADVQEAPVVHGTVEVYGAAKLSVDMIDTGGKAPADTDLTKVSSNSSRLGFKGKEDLNGALHAVYQVELGINWDGTTTRVATGVTNTTTGAVSTTDVNTLSLRNTYAGLQSESAGMLIFGIHDTPYKLATGGLDLFADSMGDYNAIIGNVNGTANFDLRPKDTIHYQSPTWGGFHVRAATSTSGTESSNGANSDPSAYSASAVYASGPLYATLAHEIHKNSFTSWDAATTITGTKAGVGFAFGGTKLAAVYETLNDDKANSPFSRNALYLALSQKLGRETIKLAYGIADDGDNPVTETGATQITAGIDHAFSKRTTIYALYSTMDNDRDATYGLGQSGAGGAFTPGAGEDPSVVSVGINHLF